MLKKEFEINHIDKFMEVILEENQHFAKKKLNVEEVINFLSREKILDDIVLQEHIASNDKMTDLDKFKIHLQFLDFEGATKFIKHVNHVRNFNVDSYNEYINKIDRLLSRMNEFFTAKNEIKLESVINYGEPVQIFISHSSQNALIADHFLELLLEHGLTQSNIIMEHNVNHLTLSPGEQYLEGILEHIKRSEVFISIIDEDFLKSQMCNVELGIALGAGLLPLPIFTNEEARNIDKIYNGASHIETVKHERYLNKILQRIGCEPNKKIVQDFILKVKENIS